MAAHERYETRINRAIALVDAHPDADLGLEALAEAACLSPHHFHRIFKALSGETVHEFTTRIRMERAVTMARLEPMLPWKRIAARCGYRSMPVFSRAFRRHFGVNPAAFDLEAYWANRPDAREAMQVSRYFLRPAPAPPDGFEVEIVERPEARLAVSRRWAAMSNRGGSWRPTRSLSNGPNASGSPFPAGGFRARPATIRK